MVDKRIPAEDSNGAMMALERRAAARRATRFKGRLEMKPGSVNCDISNLSVQGAKLTAAANVVVSQNVSLVVEQCEAIGARVVWQHDGAIGVRFTDDPEEIARTLAGYLGK